MFEFTFREKLMLAAAIVGGAVLTVWAVLIAADYIAHDPNDPLTKAGGLSRTQQRAIDHKQ